jgi:hypothetical protein
MSDKCPLGSVNNNLKVIALIALICIFFIVVLYYFKSTINKHNLIENFFTGGTAKINKTSYSNIIIGSPKNIEINDRYNGDIKLRNCQVYFVGDNEKQYCDTLYSTDPLNTNCKYEFKDNWKEIDTITYSDKIENKIDKKIYNKEFNNNTTIENQNNMTACFKNISTSDNKFRYKNNSLVTYDNIGTVNNNTINNNTLRLKTEGSVDNYISKFFNVSQNNINDHDNMIDSICSIRYDNIPNLKTTFYKFNLIQDNNEWVLDNLKDVVLNRTQTQFEGETPSTFLSSNTFGIYVSSFDGRFVKFTVFKSSNIPDKPVQVYRFKYNYLCDGKVLEYSNNISTTIHMKELLDNTSKNEVSSHTFDLEFDNSQESKTFWNNPNFKSSTFENKHDIIKKELDNLQKIYNEQINKQHDTSYLTDIIKENRLLIINSNNDRNTFHTKVNINGIDEGDFDQESIVGLTSNNIPNFNYTKGYNLVVTDKNTSQPVGRIGVAEPIVESEERMYPPIRNVTSTNHSIEGQAYGNGNYVISFNNTYPRYHPWNCFNSRDTIGGHWDFPGTRRYIQPNGTYRNTLTDNIVPGYNGDWLKIKLPVAINLTRYSFKARPGFLSRSPGNFKIYGSNDEITWVELTTGTNISYVNDSYETNVSTSNHYTSFGLVVNKLVGGNGHASGLNFDEWFIYGKEKIEPIPINSYYKYLSFANTGSSGYSLTYDFTPFNNLTSWRNYAISFGATTNVTSFALGGVYISSAPVGHITYPLPNNYDYIDVIFSNPHRSGRVNLYIDNVLKMTASPRQTRTYSGSYTNGQILKIDEPNASVIGKNLIIKLSRTHTEYTINFPENTECDVLVVGGGGAGGKFGGGGGAGSVLFKSNIVLNGAISIHVGKGGIGSESRDVNGENGFQSKINIKNVNYIADGGGGGGTRQNGNTGWIGRHGNTGGSGGGASHSNRGGQFKGGATTKSKNKYLGWETNGFNGGDGRPNTSGGNPNHASGGGGGAGGLGQKWDSTGGGNGGLAKEYISIFGKDVGHNGYFGGGGGGNTWRNGGDVGYANGGNGLFGGGGNGGLDGSNDISGGEGMAGTGGGGGGSKWDGGSAEDQDGGDGGSGIVIIRYKTTLSNTELIRRSSEVDKNAIDYMSQSLTYFGNDANIRENTTWDSSSNMTKIPAYKLKTISIMSYMFLQRGEYNFDISLGIKNSSIIYMRSNLSMGSNIKITNVNVNVFKTAVIKKGGFYIFTYTCDILLNTDEVINFNITDTRTGTNIYNYLYGGLLLHNENIGILSGTSRNNFEHVLFKNNTKSSMQTISNYLANTSVDHWNIRKYTSIIERANKEIRDKKKSEQDNIRRVNNEFINTKRTLDRINYNDPKWFKSNPATLKKNPKPQAIFSNYQESDFITYEKIQNVMERTPTIIGNVGLNSTTNFTSQNNSKRSIYILR